MTRLDLPDSVNIMFHVTDKLTGLYTQILITIQKEDKQAAAAEDGPSSSRVGCVIY